MARTRAAENTRPRSKILPIEETIVGINKFEEILTAIHDFTQEGFPYRDAARTKAETKFREYVRQVFGERSPEFQTYRNHKLRTSNQAETAQSIAVIKRLMHLLEEKKLELQGLTPSPQPVGPAETSPSTSPQITLVPPTAQITMTPQHAINTRSMKVSLAMSTNLDSPAAPPIAAPIPSLAHPHGLDSRISSFPNAETMAQLSPPPVETPKAAQVPPQGATPPVPFEHESHGKTDSAAQTLPGDTSFPSLAPTPAESTTVASAYANETSATQPGELSAITATSSPPSSQLEEAASTPNTMNHLSIQSGSGPNPVQLVRKVCLRFPSVVRQLRLRKDYRPTLEVDDVDDLQDLLWALLKMEFDEVGVDEWSPPYTNGGSRRTFLLDKDQIAFVAKKTLQGLSSKELADQVRADSARYAAREQCSTLFCFIYDPEGRIGSPSRLESELTSVGGHCKVEVLVAPK